MTPEVESTIKREIQFMFGRSIVSSRDCIELSEEIFRLTRSRLNSNTLRRFFGLIKTDYSPSPSTLLILCNYCGFVSIDEAATFRNNKGDDRVADKSVVNYLLSLFKEVPVETGKNETFCGVVKQTVIFLSQHPGMIERFQSMVAKTTNGQEYYFEGFIQIDFLNSSYGNGLRYYLNEKIEPGAQIFGHSLLVFRYWLTEDEVVIEHHFQQVTRFGLYPSLSSNIPGRYFASLLYYNHAKSISQANNIIIIQKYHASIPAEDGLLQRYFAITVAEALILTGNYEEGLFYLEMVLKEGQIFQMMEESEFHHLYLLKSLALCEAGQLKHAQVIYNMIRPSSFSFLSKKMQTILYGYLTRLFSKKISQPESAPERLIQETGFTRLGKLMPQLSKP